MNTRLFKTDEISAEITKIIDESKKYCFLVTPYFYAWEQLKKSLAKAAEQQKKVVFFLRDDDRYKEGGEYYDTSVKLLKECYFDIVYVTNLHAKLYMNEKEVLITSMNLFNYSMQNNFEIGTILSNSECFKRDFIYGELMGTEKYYKKIEGRYFREEREKEELEKKKEEERLEEKKRKEEERKQLFEIRNSKSNFNVAPEDSGFCIRCGKVIPLNPEKPFCPDCYRSWEFWNDYNGDNSNFPEKYCHICGENIAGISMKTPCCRKHSM